LNYISNNDYITYRNGISSREHEDSESGTGGGNYYTGILSRNSFTYLNIVFSELEKGNLSLVDVSLNLKVKINNLDILLNRFYKKYGLKLSK